MIHRVLTLLLFCSPCAQAGCQAIDGKQGSVRQLAFTSDSKQLLVLNSREWVGINPRSVVFSGMRLFSTTDWKVVADSGEQDVFAPSMALSRGNTCVFMGTEYSRHGFGNPNGEYLYQNVDLMTLKLKKFDPTSLPRRENLYGPAAFACTDNKLLIASSHGSSPGLHVFIFDLKADKKTVELQGFPKKGLKAERMLAAFNGDNKHVVTLLDREFRLHCADTGKLLNTMLVDSQVHAMALSANGKNLVAFCADGQILLMESNLSKKENPLKLDAYKFSLDSITLPSIAFVGNDYIAIFLPRAINADGQMEGGEIKLYDTKEWKLRHTFAKKHSWTRCIAGSLDGRWLAAGFGIDGSVPGSVCIWEAATGKLVTEFK
jgi:WD40 repeat protein